MSALTRRLLTITIMIMFCDLAALAALWAVGFVPGWVWFLMTF